MGDQPVPDGLKREPVKPDVKDEEDLIPPEGSCHFLVKRKKRFCRFKPNAGQNYCAEHAGLLGIELNRKRIQCPLDAKHTCYEDQLHRHLRKCKKRTQTIPVYHSTGINTGDDAGEIIPHPKVTVSTVSDQELQDMIDTVNRIYQDQIGRIETEILSHPCLREELENTTYGVAAMRHRKQQASIIGQMDKVNLLRDGVCYVEMGAGKGQLSHWLHTAVNKNTNSRFLLVDRSHVRHKYDNLHKEEMTGPVMERIRIDIEHLNLGNVPSMQTFPLPVVAFGKHLCGGATDLALRCVLETLSETSTDACNEVATPENKKLKLEQNRSVLGVAIALCCHHRCTWKPYVGKDFFKSCGLGARDFQLICNMSSWATCCWKGWSQSKKKQRSPGSEVRSQNLELSENTGSSGQTGSSVNDSGLTKTSCSDRKDGSSGVNQECDERAIGSDIENFEKTGSVENNSGSTSGPAATSDLPHQSSDMIGEDAELAHEGTEDLQFDQARLSKLSVIEREEIGRKCKRLIDYGRVKYLQDKGLNCHLKVYIEEYLTPENVMLVAVKHPDTV